MENICLGPALFFVLLHEQTEFAALFLNDPISGFQPALACLDRGGNELPPCVRVVHAQAMSLGEPIGDRELANSQVNICRWAGEPIGWRRRHDQLALARHVFFLASFTLVWKLHFCSALCCCHGNGIWTRRPGLPEGGKRKAAVASRKPLPLAWDR